MRSRVATLIVAIAIGTSGRAAAQELPTTPDIKDGGCKGSFLATPKSNKVMSLREDLEGNFGPQEVDEDSGVDLDELSKAYVSGEWVTANRLAAKLLDKVKKCPTVKFEEDKNTGTIKATEERDASTPAPFDLTLDYVHLLWVSKVPAAAEPAVFSMLVHKPAEPLPAKPGSPPPAPGPPAYAKPALTPYSRVLPGLSGIGSPRLVEVFLSNNAEASVASFYVSKPLPDPLLEQVPAVIDKFLGPLFSQFDRLSPDHQLREEARKPKPPVIGYTARTVDLPEPRSSIEVTMRATQPITASQLDSDLANLAISVKAQGLVGPFTRAYRDVLKELAALMKDTPPKACHAVGTADECKRALHEAITKVFEIERASFPRDPLRRDVDRFEAAFHTFVEGLKPSFVNGKAALDNSPLTHLSFGLLSSYALYVGGDDLRAKIDNGKVVNEPLKRAMQMVVLNISLEGYQSKTMKRFLPEPILQPFAGIVFSPDPGIAVGGSLRVMGNIGINAGYAYMFIARPEDGLDFGAVLDEKIKDENQKDTTEFRYPKDLRQDPLQSGRLHTLFIGASYNFK